MIIPDTNLLLYAYNVESEFHPRASRWWQSILQGNEAVGIPAVVSVGFVRIATNPTFAGRRVTVSETLSLVESWFNYPHVAELTPATGHFVTLSTGAPIGPRWVEIASQTRTWPLAIENDAELHTNDNDFSRFPGLRWQNPLQ